VYTIIGIKCFHFRYSTASSNGQPVGNFLKKLNMPNDQVLDIIGLDTGFLQVLSHKIKEYHVIYADMYRFLYLSFFLKEPLHDGKVSTSYREQNKWLERSVALTHSNWSVYTTSFICSLCSSLYYYYNNNQTFYS
jgi:hypothetical protein